MVYNIIENKDITNAAGGKNERRKNNEKTVSGSCKQRF
jgi:hypothetical protein